MTDPNRPRDKQEAVAAGGRVEQRGSIQQQFAGRKAQVIGVIVVGF